MCNAVHETPGDEVCRCRYIHMSIAARNEAGEYPRAEMPPTEPHIRKNLLPLHTVLVICYNAENDDI